MNMPVDSINFTYLATKIPLLAICQSSTMVLASIRTKKRCAVAVQSHSGEKEKAMSYLSGGWRYAIAFLAFLCGVAGARAADAESRIFHVTVDGKNAGSYTMTISAEKDGVITMTGQAEIRVKYLGGLYAYKYSYSGEETWKDGRLQRFASRCNDDGKEFEVSASSDGKELRVKVNGKESKANVDSWLTSYWRLPSAALRKGELALIDADTGRPMSAKLELVANEKLTLAGLEMTCGHYRLSGGAQAELWFDAKERLIREEWIEDGHKTVLELGRLGK
jgi:hypothetical protein